MVCKKEHEISRPNGQNERNERECNRQQLQLEIIQFRVKLFNVLISEVQKIVLKNNLNVYVNRETQFRDWIRVISNVTGNSHYSLLMVACTIVELKEN